MEKTYKMIMNLMNCTHAEAEIILNNVIQSDLIQNAITLKIKKEYEV